MSSQPHSPFPPALRALPALLPVLLLLALVALCAAPACPLAAQTPAGPQPTLHTTLKGFTDLNGNGLLDCGEPVTIVTTFATNNSGTPALTGTLLLPAAGSAGLIFQPGSVRIDPDLTTGCAGTITRGNSAEDTSAQIDFSCPPDPPDNNAWTLVATYQATYANVLASSFTATAHATTSDGRAYDDQFTQQTSGATCTSAPPALALTKTTSGTGQPGSVLLSTLTLRDLSGLGDGGAQLTETVPADTVFDSQASSPGWLCSPDNNPGSLCQLAAGNVPAGGTLSRFFAVTLRDPLPAGVTAILNTACVRLGAAAASGCASTTTPTAGAPLLTLAKTLGSGSAIPGATLAFLLTAANHGNQDAAGVTLVETVPAHTTFAPAGSDPAWSCASPAAGSSCTLPLGTLAAAGPALARTFAVRIDDPLPASVTALANTACAHAPPLPDACDSLSPPTLAAPNLKLTKSLTSGNGTPGGTLLYDVSVQNIGNQDAASVTATETVPTLATFAPDASSPAWTCLPGPAAPATCTAALGPLPAGATLHAAFALRLDPTFPAGAGPIANTACTAPPAQTPSCGTVTTPAAGHPHLTLAKTGSPQPIHPGDRLPYNLTAGNAGNQDAAGVTLQETVPGHTTFLPAQSSPGWSCSPDSGPGSSCTLPLGTLAAGATLTATFSLQVDATLPPGLQTLANSACAADGAGDTACATFTSPAPVTVAATLQDSIAGNSQNPLAHPGDTVHYTLLVTNPSPAAATGLEIATDLDPHLTLAAGSVTATAGLIDLGNHPGDTRPSVHLDSLAPGASLTITFDATVAATLPQGLQLLSSQSTLQGTNIEPTVSDDPDTPAPLDPTTTPLATALLPVPAIPTLSRLGFTAFASLLALACLLRLRRPRPLTPTPGGHTSAMASADGSPALSTGSESTGDGDAQGRLADRFPDDLLAPATPPSSPTSSASRSPSGSASAASTTPASSSDSPIVDGAPGCRRDGGQELGQDQTGRGLTGLTETHADGSPDERPACRHSSVANQDTRSTPCVGTCSDTSSDHHAPLAPPTGDAGSDRL